jgi:hypothetical protein
VAFFIVFLAANLFCYLGAHFYLSFTTAPAIHYISLREDVVSIGAISELLLSQDETIIRFDT